MFGSEKQFRHFMGSILGHLIQRRDDGNSTEIKLPTKLNNSDLEDQPNDSEMPGRICRTTSLERTLTENHPLTEKERYQNLDMNRYEDVS
ncbi:hypothetical protein AVEN_181656-1 [Araneus ventricosus]|uniref:Uncharacterized protein n=1 Tax=Araneus ventricosus TaxID=182803 RepID=A0A4Y2VW77_ARAVE|nr:hypothetical protein AVEN_181656-1 [Araneus ventricosus]